MQHLLTQREFYHQALYGTTYAVYFFELIIGNIWRNTKFVGEMKEKQQGKKNVCCLIKKYRAKFWEFLEIKQKNVFLYLMFLVYAFV